MGRVVYQVRRWPADFISYNRSNLSPSGTHMQAQPDASKPSHGAERRNIYVMTQILHTVHAITRILS